MEKQGKAVELFDKFMGFKMNPYNDIEMTYQTGTAKRNCLIAIENEYNSLREMLFNLRSCHVIESEKVYLHRLQELIDEEQKVKQEINLL